MKTQQVVPILLRIHEPDCEANPGKYRNRQPDNMLDKLYAYFLGIPGSRIQLVTLIGIAFNFLFYPGKHIYPDCLKTEKTAKYSGCDRGDRKQGHRKQQQQQGHHPDILRKYGEIEDMKLTIIDVQQYRLLAIPAQIGAKKENQPE